MTESHILEYIWIDGQNKLRSKVKIHRHISKNNSIAIKLEDIPIWNFDGSSTGQATTADSEVILVPAKIYMCPFRQHLKNNAYLVLCSTYNSKDQPIFNNHRYHAIPFFEKYKIEDAWFGLEQEYFMYDNKTDMPIGFDRRASQGKYYCSVGVNKSHGKALAEKHMEFCLHAGIQFAGLNQEVAPGQWEFQIGTCGGLDACDDLWAARFILAKLSDEFDITINYHPKPLGCNEDWNGSGCHTNFSTKWMRNGEDGIGLSIIEDCMAKLEAKHKEHISVYGEFNDERLTGEHETSSMDKFTWSIGGRNCSVRIGNETAYNKMGYFEDRRPAANIDPYLVCPMLLDTCCC